MQKVCATILVIALVSSYEALPQTKWSRQIRNSQGQLTRERRQFPFGEWIPLSQPCPTCRPFADPLDAGLRTENIGLTPPKPPTVTRQIHGEGNFFGQDESSILSVPPPPPSAVPRQNPFTSSNTNFQFSNFAQQFNNPLSVPTQQSFPQQQLQFLPQPFLPNQPLLVNNNQQILPVLSSPNTLFGQENQGKQQINNGKVAKFNSEFKQQQKIPENVVLEQNKRPVVPNQPPTRLETSFTNKPAPFTPPIQQQQQQLQQSFVQQHQSVNFGDSILTPPPVPNATAQDIVIPGLDKEEIQLLYVPVETLRQRGTFQEQLLTQHPQNIQFHNRPSASQRPISSVQSVDQVSTKEQKGHFVTQNANNQGSSISTVKITSPQPFPTTVTPSTQFLQRLPFQQTPQPFVSATPATPTIQPFVTPSPFTQKFSSFSPDTTLSHLVTVPNTVQFSQSDIQFGTTPKPTFSQGGFQGEIINGKSQFSNFKSTPFQTQHFQQTQRPFQQQSFISQQQESERQSQQNAAFGLQGQLKEVEIQTQLPQKQLLDQQQIVLQKQEEQQRLLQQQKEKELQEEKLLKQRQQKELEAQRLLQQQRQKELDEQRFLQQQKRQKELEEQRLLQQQRQKELEEQRYLQQQRQKELDEQRFLQQQRQKELDEQRFLQQQRQKELENQRRLQQQRQNELEEKRRLQLQKQREQEEQQRLLRIQQQQREQEEQRVLRLQQQQREQEEQQRLLRLQQQQKELEEQRLLQQQKQQEQQRLLHQQKLQRQKEENIQKQQQYQFIQQQQIAQQQAQDQQKAIQQSSRHTLPDNDKLNLISQLEKESEPENPQLVPHQPPLSVFFKSYDGGEARIVDVLRELRSSNTITVLDQYFEKMPKVFVGPAGLIPPAGYGKFELPYLSNLETNRIERKIDRLPFFVAPLNFVPPPGYAKIPFPAPHVGSVVVSSESNPAMKSQFTGKENNVGSVVEDNDSGSFPMVGPELPGLINSLETETTTLRPTTFPSTPALPQTTAQLRNRRPNNSLYRSQNRKPYSKPRSQTTIKPEEEEVTQKIEVTKEPEGGIRSSFNRFLKRRRQPVKTTTESYVKNQEGKNLENRHYSVEVYHNQKNTNVPRYQHKSVFQNKQTVDHLQSGQPEHQIRHIDRTTPGDQEVYEVQPTPGFYKVQPTGVTAEAEDQRPTIPDYSDIHNLQSFEDGPVPTGSAKTITQELYRPNTLQIKEQQQHSSDDQVASKLQPKLENSQSSDKFYDKPETTKATEISDVSSVSSFGNANSNREISTDHINAQPNPYVGFEIQEVSTVTSEKSHESEIAKTEGPYTPGSVTVSGHRYTTGFGGSNEQYTSAFAEISKHHHFPGPTESSKRQYNKFSDNRPTSEIAQHLQAPLSEGFSQNPQEFETVSEVKPTPNVEFSKNQESTGTLNEQYSTGFENNFKNAHAPDVSISSVEVSPTASEGAKEQYTSDFSINSNSQNSQNGAGNSEDQRTGSFISFHQNQEISGSVRGSQVQNFPSSTQISLQEYSAVTESNRNDEYPKIIEQSYPSVTPATVSEVTENPSAQSYNSESASKDLSQINGQQQISEDQGQEVGDNLSNSHRLKLPNPSIVRVRTRVRGKTRGQVNFAASQSTTLSPVIRSKVENRQNENTEHEITTKTNPYRDYQPVKISKFNQYRGLKKPVRTTTEPSAKIEYDRTTEYEQKSNVYTIRPQRRPSNPSTVSTKRIRRPTSPIPAVESATEEFISSTVRAYSQSEESDFSPSGVSNDVYYEHTSLTPFRQKFRKHFGAPEQKSDLIPDFGPTAHSSTIQSHSSSGQVVYSEDANIVKDSTHTAVQENSDKYPDWNPSESSIDVSGIVLTTARTTTSEDQESEVEPKKFQDSKKAFDPDLEKKSGRRRVRVRVHKKPHENFETAESQNLRTVANVLVPPTSTYKPTDESNIHQLAKNSDFSFGGQKLFGLRSREYFRKKLNLTQTDRNVSAADINKESAAGEEQSTKSVENVQENVRVGGDATEKLPGPKVRTFVRKVQKSQKEDYESAPVQSTEENAPESEAGKVVRTKYRGYVRKIVKQGGSKKEDVESGEPTENDESEVKHENIESHSRQHIRVNYGGFNQTGRFNGTRYRTFVRYVKKNKIRTNEDNSHVDKEAHQSEEQGLHQTTESPTQQTTESELRSTQESELPNIKESESHSTQESELRSTQEKELRGTQESELRGTQESELRSTQESELHSTQETETQNIKEEVSPTQYPVYQTTPETHQTNETDLPQTQRSDLIQTNKAEAGPTEQTEVQENQEIVTQTTTQDPESGKILQNLFHTLREQKFQESNESEVHQTQEVETSQTQETGTNQVQKPKVYQSLRPVHQRNQHSGFLRTREPGSFVSTTENVIQESQGHQRNQHSGFLRTRQPGSFVSTTENVNQESQGYQRNQQSGFLRTREPGSLFSTTENVNQESSAHQRNQHSGFLRTREPGSFVSTSENVIQESPVHQRNQHSGFLRTREPGSFVSTTENVIQESQGYQRNQQSGFLKTREPGSLFSTTEIVTPESSEHQRNQHSGFLRTREPGSFVSTSENVIQESPVHQRNQHSGFLRTREPGSLFSTSENENQESSVHQRNQHSGFLRTREPGTFFSTTENVIQESQNKRDRPIRPKYGKTTGATEGEKFEETKKTEQNSDQQTKNKNYHTFEIRKYLRTKSKEGAFSQFTKNRYSTSGKTEIPTTTKNYDSDSNESEEFTTSNEKITATKSVTGTLKTESTPTESESETTQAFVANSGETTQAFVANTFSGEGQKETTQNDDAELYVTTTEKIEESTEIENKDFTNSFRPETTTEAKTEPPTTTIQTSSSERVESFSGAKTKQEILTERNEVERETQPDIYRFSKSSFSFDETEKFTGTKNRAHVRNITTDIIENTASFSAPGVEKRPEIYVHTFSSEDRLQGTTRTNTDATTNEKTDESTTEIILETTTFYPESTENPETTGVTEAVTKSKIAKLIKTSTTTKISHETEICYKGKCIRTKSENPDEDLKLLVDSSSTMKIARTKT